MKKTVSFLLVLALVLGLVPMAFAASHPFTDVPDSAWYAPHVAYVYENDLMNGMSATTFAPNSNMTRAMIVTVLYRIAGSPDTDGKHPFKDVPAGKWFSDPIAWAYENKVVNGMSATSFAPNSNVTREQMVTIFYNYANSCGYDTSELADLSGYADDSSIHNYAVNAFSWAVEAKIISGVDAAHLAPRNNATRAQCATIISRFMGWIDTITEPEEPTEPSVPTEPSEPTEPSVPPTEPSDPTEPSVPPTEPSDPTKPSDPDVPAEYTDALAEAKDYLSIMPFSYLGLIGQLEHDGYSHEAAVYAADNCGADWYEQAVLEAKDYIEYSAFSAEGLYDQLLYEEYTEDQAQYGVDNCGADWNAEAVECAREYLEYDEFTYNELYDQLIYEGFTENQAVYALSNCGKDWDESDSAGLAIPESGSGNTYILNTNTGKFHEPGCGSAENISPSNRYEYVGSRDDLIANGWSPCGNCDP